MNVIEIKPGIFWTGAVDWAVRDFHGYVTPSGTTYNNYLIMDDEPTLVDTVKHDFVEVGVSNIRSLIDPSKIKNIVINHIENDHLGSLDRIMELSPSATIYTTKRGRQGIDRFFDTASWNIKEVKTGDTLKTGKYTLRFVETPMIHWPDSMMTYVEGAKLLISQDAFGQHLASTTRFDDEFVAANSMTELEDSVVDYYANILMPFGKLIKSKICEIKDMGLDIDMIAPDHGVIWRSDPSKVLNMYLDMAEGKAKLQIAIIYDTMWHSTEHMTLPIMRGIIDAGVQCKVIKLRATPMSVAIKEFWKSRACLVGSPTLNNEVFPSVAEFMVHLKGLRPSDRLMGAFGSYGWGGGAVKWLYETFKSMKLPVVEPGIQVQYRLRNEDHEKCYEYGRTFAKAVKEFHEKNYGAPSSACIK
ncbi:FprA family A-type flavoprotein [Candidatus Magnetomonas plexicatena]|uniref:FprA family A-type flavoprotein n=1 Tax=Candidatus Magnetomonas plexicatena TaxID=2552947 RepID=UPI001C7554D1|nr:FprA family A-type flavoprotein [Nitrospirales bacterium LBB_01]